MGIFGLTGQMLHGTGYQGMNNLNLYQLSVFNSTILLSPSAGTVFTAGTGFFTIDFTDGISSVSLVNNELVFSFTKEITFTLIFSTTTAIPSNSGDLGPFLLTDVQHSTDTQFGDARWVVAGGPLYLAQPLEIVQYGTTNEVQLSTYNSSSADGLNFFYTFVFLA